MSSSANFKFEHFFVSFRFVEYLTSNVVVGEKEVEMRKVAKKVHIAQQGCLRSSHAVGKSINEVTALGRGGQGLSDDSSKKKRDNGVSKTV